jgi:hypothetical protein
VLLEIIGDLSTILPHEESSDLLDQAKSYGLSRFYPIFDVSHCGNLYHLKLFSHLQILVFDPIMHICVFDMLPTCLSLSNQACVCCLANHAGVCFALSLYCILVIN